MLSWGWCLIYVFLILAFRGIPRSNYISILVSRVWLSFFLFDSFSIIESRVPLGRRKKKGKNQTRQDRVNKKKRRKMCPKGRRGMSHFFERNHGMESNRGTTPRSPPKIEHQTKQNISVLLLISYLNSHATSQVPSFQFDSDFAVQKNVTNTRRHHSSPIVYTPMQSLSYIGHTLISSLPNVCSFTKMTRSPLNLFFYFIPNQIKESNILLEHNLEFG